MAKKYRYTIGSSAECDTIGTIDLTKAEAKIVAYAINQDNWKIIQTESYSGYYWIDIDHPMEIPDKE